VFVLTGLAVVFVSPFTVPGGHMEPTIKVGATVWAIPASGQSVARGDIVIWESQDNRYPTSARVTRVIAIGGDTIESRDNDLYLNGQLVDEPYAAPDPVRFRIPVPPTRVPDDAVFFMGDSRNNSYDSRSIGPVPARTITKRVVLTNGPPAWVRWAALALTGLALAGAVALWRRPSGASR
jgi:signal peptidase I